MQVKVVNPIGTRLARMQNKNLHFKNEVKTCLCKCITRAAAEQILYTNLHIWMEIRVIMYYYVCLPYRVLLNKVFCIRYEYCVNKQVWLRIRTCQGQVNMIDP